MTACGDITDIPFLRAVSKELRLLPIDPEFLEKLPPQRPTETQVGSMDPNTARILELYHCLKCEAWKIERDLGNLRTDSAKRKKLSRRLQYIIGFTDQLWTFLLVLLVSESVSGPIALRQGGIIVQKNQPFKTQREVHHEAAPARATLH